MTVGCDISYAQKTVDFDALKGHVSFVISKATEGVGFTDPTFSRNWSETKRVGLVRGAYHFARPDLGNTAQDEAHWFLVNLGSSNGVFALDYEVSWDGDVVGWCKTWLDTVKTATGITPYIYLNRSDVRSHDWSSVLGYPLWLAAYDGNPTLVPPTTWPTLSIKQWTSSGTLPGIAGLVDLNTALSGELSGTLGDEMAFKDDPDAQAFVKDVHDTLEAMKAAYDPLVGHQDLGHPTKYVPHTHKTDEGAMV